MLRSAGQQDQSCDSESCSNIVRAAINGCDGQTGLLVAKGSKLYVVDPWSVYPQAQTRRAVHKVHHKTGRRFPARATASMRFTPNEVGTC